jgi:phosphoribosyl-AMP cyclohydrolase
MATRSGSIFDRILGREPEPAAASPQQDPEMPPPLPPGPGPEPHLASSPQSNPAVRRAVSETSTFAPRATTEQVEEGRLFAPKFDADGLITCVITDAWSAEVLMVAHMNPEALAKTIATGEAWFYSRSRQKLWKKGESSGHTQRVVEMRVDCDQDALWMRVEQIGAGVCHTGRTGCFYRAIPLKQTDFRRLILEFRDADKVFDPAQVYGQNGDTPET